MVRFQAEGVTCKPRDLMVKENGLLTGLTFARDGKRGVRIDKPPRSILGGIEDDGDNY
jgi:hypothetical protein